MGWVGGSFQSGGSGDLLVPGSLCQSRPEAGSRCSGTIIRDPGNSISVQRLHDHRHNLNRQHCLKLHCGIFWENLSLFSPSPMVMWLLQGDTIPLLSSWLSLLPNNLIDVHTEWLILDTDSPQSNQKLAKFQQQELTLSSGYNITNTFPVGALCLSVFIATIDCRVKFE